MSNKLRKKLGIARVFVAMAGITGRLIINPLFLLLSLFLVSSRIALGTALTITGNNRGYNSNSGSKNSNSKEEITVVENEELLSELRVSAYLATISLYTFYSAIIKDFKKPIVSVNPEGEEISNAIQDYLVYT